MSRHLSKLMLVILSLAIASPALAQRIVHTPPLSVPSGVPVPIEYQIAGATGESVVETAVFYRFQGDVAYRRIRATANGSLFSASIPAMSQNAGYIEYYLVAELINGGILNLPTINPSENPFQVNILQTEQDGPLITEVADIEFRVMSPLPATPMLEDDLLIAIALFSLDSLAVTDSLRMTLNGVDVTDEADIGPYLVTYAPAMLAQGSYKVEIFFRNGRVITPITNWTFTVVSAQSQFAQSQRRARPVNGDVELTTRAQSTAGTSYDFVRGAANLRGSAGWLTYSANGLLTSQEDARLQPQNRYGLQVAAKHYLNVEAGHVYPSMNPLLLAGRRVYGVNATSSMLYRLMNLQVVYGELNRKVPTLYKDIAIQIDSTDFAGTVITDTTYSLLFQPGGAGTHRRTLLASRLSFGSGRFAQFGINALKVKDDIRSIAVVDSLNDADSAPYLNRLSAQQRAALLANPLAFAVDLSNPTPQDNIVAGFDFKANLHGGRIQFATDAAVSALNTNIAAGPLSQKYADDLGVEIDADILNRLESISWLFVINENVSALPIRFRNDEAEFFIPKGIFAYQNRLSLNYFKHNLSVQQRWIGPDYISLANNGIRRDVAGYTIADRFRMFKNTLYVNLQAEKLWDNLAQQLSSRTYTTNYGVSTSWYPVNFKLPRVTLSVRRQFRDNNITPRNGLISPALLDVAVRHLDIQSLSPDTLVTTLATPRLNKTWQVSTGLSRQFDVFDMVHDVTLNVSTISTDDAHFRYGDFNTRTYSMGVQTDVIRLPLRTNLNLGYTQAEAQSGLNKLDLFALVFGGNYFLFEDALMLTAEASVINSISLTTRIDVNDNGTPANAFDDFYAPVVDSEEESRTYNYIGSFGAEYRFLQRHVISTTASYTSVQTRAVNAVTLPNDYFLQVRYQFQF